MRRLLALLSLLFVGLRYTEAATCVASSGTLQVNAGASCDITAPLKGLTEIKVYGTIYFKGTPGTTPPSLEATNIYVYSNGRILANENGYPAAHGPGKGSPSGSGGKRFIIAKYLLKLR